MCAAPRKRELRVWYPSAVGDRTQVVRALSAELRQDGPHFGTE